MVLYVAEYQAKFGILVDELGDIPEIPSSRIDPIPALMGRNGQALTESLVKPLPHSNERILIMLSAEAILRRLTGVAAGEVGAEAEMQPRLEVRYGIE